MPDPVPLALYANGLMLFEGPFRPYSDPATQQVVHDLTDGYFPTELQSRFPDGVPFKVSDRRTETFEGRELPGFPGAGFKIGGECGPSRLVTGANIHRVGEESGHQAPQSGAAFLKNLPAAVIKDGKVIDIRGGVAEALQLGPDGKVAVSVVKTAATTAMEAKPTDTTQSGASPSSKSPSDVATIQVKCPNGGERLILRMRFTETVGDLRRYIDEHRKTKVSRDYKLLAGFPRKQLDQLDVTIESAGLVPTAAVHMM